MIRTLCLMLSVALALSGCQRIQESRFNPFNILSGPRIEPVEGRNALLPDSALRPGPLDQRGRIDQIAGLATDPVPGGIILRATGIAEVQGAYDAELVELGRSGGTLVYAFLSELPLGTGTGTEFSRQVTAAVALSDQELAGITTIRVEGARNAVTVRR